MGEEALFVVEVKKCSKLVGPDIVRWGRVLLIYGMLPKGCYLVFSGFTNVAIRTAKELEVLLYDGSVLFH